MVFVVFLLGAFDLNILLESWLYDCFLIIFAYLLNRTLGCVLLAEFFFPVRQYASCIVG